MASTPSATSLLKTLGGDVTTLFRQLLGAKWRDVPFPYTSCELDVRHDLATHKPADRSGANVESWLAPLEFTFDIPFLNGIGAAPSESWKPGTLYPTQMRAFLDAFQDTSKGLLQHPELGQIFCKPNHAKFRWAASELTGIRVQAAFIQTYADDEGDLSIASPSPIGTLHTESDALDANLSAAAVQVPGLPTFPMTFHDFVRSFEGAIDQITLLEKQYGGALDSLVGQVNDLEDHLDLLSGSTGALMWPLYSSIEAIKSAARTAKKVAFQRSTQVSIYIVPADKTLGAVVADLAQYATVALEDIIKLNAWIMSAPTVPAGSKVRFYGPPPTPDLHGRVWRWLREHPSAVTRG